MRTIYIVGGILFIYVLYRFLNRGFIKKSEEYNKMINNILTDERYKAK